MTSGCSLPSTNALRKAMIGRRNIARNTAGVVSLLWNPTHHGYLRPRHDKRHRKLSRPLPGRNLTGFEKHPQIAKATREKIQATAAAMGYQPNLSAANLAQFRHASNGRTVHAAIAWINSWKIPTDMRAYRQFDLYWSNARETAEAAGFRVEEFTIEQSTNVARLQNILLTRNIRGIIIPLSRGPAIGKDVKRRL